MTRGKRQLEGLYQSMRLTQVSVLIGLGGDSRGSTSARQPTQVHIRVHSVSKISQLDPPLLHNRVDCQL